MSAYDTALLALSGVQGYWPLDDAAAATSFRDASGGPIGAIPFSRSFATLGNPSILPGDSATSLHKAFGNVSYQLTWASMSTAARAAVQQTGPLAMMCWVQPDNVTGNSSGDQFLFGQWNGWMSDLLKRASRALLTGLSDSLSPNFAVPGAPAFLAVTYDLANVKTYVNGILIKTSPRTGPVSTSTNNLEIGGILGGSGLTGSLQKVAFLSSAPSQAQIQALYVIGAQSAAELAGRNFNVYPFSRQALGANAARKSVTLTNLSDTPMYLSLADTSVPAAALQGPLIAPNGGVWSSGTWKQAVQVVHSNWLGTKLLLIEEV